MTWLRVQLPALLYGWFWIGMALSGLFAPEERVADLGSEWITEGWHLSVMALAFGLTTLGLYSWRMRGEGTPPGPSSHGAAP